jgi:hypothetical protein
MMSWLSFLGQVGRALLFGGLIGLERQWRQRSTGLRTNGLVTVGAAMFVIMDAGASQKVHFELKNRDLGMVTEDGRPIIAGGDYTVSIGGGQPDTGAPGATGHFHVEGQIDLPE